MLFAVTSPRRPDDQICLFFDSDEAFAEAGAGQVVVPVFVHYDALFHRLLPTGGKVPTWSVPAEYRSEGYIVPQGTIPGPLYSN